uniref:Antifreeze protein n=1 Tax=Panagrolaimus sp. PS1159 TaxID=55785 RepID=A0AC35GIQ9_9BILA
MNSSLIFIIFTLLFMTSANAGPLAYAACQAACASGAAAVAGATAFTATPAAVAAYAACQAGCAALLIAPTP